MVAAIWLRYFVAGAVGTWFSPAGVSSLTDALLKTEVILRQIGARDRQDGITRSVITWCLNRSGYYRSWTLQAELYGPNLRLSYLVAPAR